MKNKDLLALGHKIKFERTQRQLSQEELAEQADLSQHGISDIECGASDPKYTTLLQISKAFNMTLSELFDFKL